MPAAALPLVADLDFGFAAAASSFLSASGLVASAGFGLAASFFRADFGFGSGFAVLAARVASGTGTGLARGSPCASAVELPKITAKIAAETRIRTSTPGAAP